MPYRVFWSPDAERILKDVHAASSEPIAVMNAARDIDRQLHLDRYEFGESRHENVRIGFQRPLGIQFEVIEDVKTVIVFHVWMTKRQSR